MWRPSRTYSSAGQRRHVDAFHAVVEGEHDAVVQQAFVIHALADLGTAHQIRHALLENAGSNSALDLSRFWRSRMTLLIPLRLSRCARQSPDGPPPMMPT